MGHSCQPASRALCLYHGGFALGSCVPLPSMWSSGVLHYERPDFEHEGDNNTEYLCINVCLRFR